MIRLFAEALLLVQEGKLDIRDRLRLIERTLDLSLYLMRRRAKQGELTAEHLAVLDAELGISAKWILEGDTAALGARILAYCRPDTENDSSDPPAETRPEARRPG